MISTIQDFMDFANFNQNPIAIELDEIKQHISLACLKKDFEFIRGYLDNNLMMGIYIEFFILDESMINKLNKKQISFDNINFAHSIKEVK